MEISITEVYDLLSRLGLKADHTSFFYTSCAVWLCVKRKERLLLAAKWLYPEVAKHYKTAWYVVEWNISWVIEEIWDKHREHLEKLAGRTMKRKPHPAQFPGLLTANLLKGRAA